MAMTFDEFRDYASENIKHYLPHDYKDGEVSVFKVTKLGSTYTGLSVRTRNSNMAVTVNLDQHFKEYQQDVPISHIMRDMAQRVMTHSLNQDIEWITDYDRAKKKLYVRVSNAETNEAVLANAPHLPKEDIVMTCHILISKGDSIASTIVTNNLLDSYGVSEEQLFADAIDNSQRLFPIRVQPLESVIFDMAADAGYEHPINSNNHMLVVTNDQAINGASALFYPEVMEKVADMIDDDYYIIPSSIHECLVIPESDQIGYEHLESMLNQVNSMMVAKEEQLSNHVYHYDSREKLFELAEDYAIRSRHSEYDFSTYA